MSTNLHLVAFELKFKAVCIRSLVRYDLRNTSANYPDSIGRMLHVQPIVEDCKGIISNLLQSK